MQEEPELPRQAEGPAERELERLEAAREMERVNSVMDAMIDRTGAVDDLLKAVATLAFSADEPISSRQLRRRLQGIIFRCAAPYTLWASGPEPPKLLAPCCTNHIPNSSRPKLRAAS